jgi:predicted KAP-like P-loop ATPase
VATPLWSDNPSPLDLLGFADVTAPVVEAVLRDKLDPVTVGIEGDWGSGTTTMLELLAATLREDKSVVVVETHPWEYDPATDAKATLIAEVLGEIHAEAEKRKNLTDKAREKFKALARRVQVSKAIKLGVNSALSMGLPKIDELLGLFKEDAETVPDPTLQGFRDEFRALMEEDLTEIQRVVVLVDDLDRCLPETVVATLEAVKLFLSVPKMAFVLAADRRAVSHTVATKYEPSTLAAELGRQYLEKIVHIPVRVPALGRGETEAYLALLMLQRHLAEDSELAPFIEHCDQRRAAGEGDVLEGLPQESLVGQAKDDLQLAAMLAPVLYERLAGNPRRLKRFLNAYWLRSTVAGRRGIELQPNALAKLMVLEELGDAPFNALVAWMREGVFPSG